jgi:hypothetical protein
MRGPVRTMLVAGFTAVMLGAVVGPVLAKGKPTKVRRQGQKTLGDLRQGDSVLVRAKACKADLANGTPHLTATSIVAHDASHASAKSDHAAQGNAGKGKSDSGKDDDND